MKRILVDDANEQNNILEELPLGCCEVIFRHVLYYVEEDIFLSAHNYNEYYPEEEHYYFYGETVKQILRKILQLRLVSKKFDTVFVTSAFLCKTINLLSRLNIFSYSIKNRERGRKAFCKYVDRNFNLSDPILSGPFSDILKRTLPFRLGCIFAECERLKLSTMDLIRGINSTTGINSTNGKTVIQEYLKLVKKTTQKTVAIINWLTLNDSVNIEMHLRWMKEIMTKIQEITEETFKLTDMLSAAAAVEPQTKKLKKK